MAPLVSVLLPVFDSERHLADAARSILNQTHKELELIILDDGSTDGTRNIAFSLAREDPRVTIVAHDENKGLPTRLNEGLLIAKGKYIARMDADDLSVPGRLHLQVNFLESNPEIALVGSYIRLFGGNRSCVVQVATSPSLIKWRLLFGNSIGHVTIVATRAFFTETGGYDESLKVAQDYDLWLRAMDRFRMANLPEVLVNVRENSGSTSRRMSPKRQQNAIASLNKAHRDFLSRNVSKGVSALCFSPSLLREENSLSSHVPTTIEVIDNLTSVFLENRYSLTEREGRVIRSEARYKIAQLMLLAGIRRRDLLEENRPGLMRRRDIPLAITKHLVQKSKHIVTRC